MSAVRNRHLRAMTVHRGGGRASRARRRERLEGRPLTLLETVTAFTALQSCLCLAAVAVIFTLQYLDGERYQLLGRYYRAVMGRAGEEAVEVGAFSRPIRWEDIFAELERAVMGQVIRANGEPGDAGETGMGGESPYIPTDLNEGPVVVTAAPRYPVYGTLTSPFGLREHPVTGAGDFHTGMDIAAPEGSNIYAAYPGAVAEVGSSEIYGNYVTLDHGGGLTTRYCHCSRILAKEGQRLPAGARIAEVGSTGMVTGPHLHFEARVDGDLIQPAWLFGL